MAKREKSKKNDAVAELFQVLLLLETTDEMKRFFNDLCTPQEIRALAERWKVCKILEQGDLSYRDIHKLTGASLATIGRVARFLHTEPHKGYQLALSRLAESK